MHFTSKDGEKKHRLLKMDEFCAGAPVYLARAQKHNGTHGAQAASSVEYPSSLYDADIEFQCLVCCRFLNATFPGPETLKVSLRKTSARDEVAAPCVTAV